MTEETAYDVEVERDVKVVMDDGAVLLTDVYHPVGLDDGPAILTRVPYGRRMPLGGELYARRGYRFVAQAVRGTDGSEGDLSYLAEAADGATTAAWIERQGWFNGNLGVTGGSYLGFTAWALLTTRPPCLKAAAISLASSDRRSNFFPGGTVALDITLGWNAMMAGWARSGRSLADLTPAEMEESQARRAESLGRAFSHLPLGEADVVATGAPVEQYRHILEHEHPDDPFWDAVDFSDQVAGFGIPTLLTDVWQDYNVPRILDDYLSLRRVGTPVWLVMGSGTHGPMRTPPPDDVAAWNMALFDTYLRGATGLLPEDRVAIEVTGTAGEWRRLPDWPPMGVEQRWYLHPAGALSPEPAPASEPDRYRYDPTDPTPAAGGNSLLPQYAGTVDNRDLEARPDVLTYTSPALTEDVEVIGPITAELVVTSSRRHTDFFVRVCDVDADGTSRNVTDGITRLRPSSTIRRPDGTLAVTVRLWDLAHRFARGHRIRVQVSSGAHPRYARNLGTGQPALTATGGGPADQVVFHDLRRRSAVVVNLTAGGGIPTA